ncbi:MAG: sporulation integral membrane protein YtvI [Clostridia bacterium]|nr:sporulation integral membrane protein YtvI [Clostridia bacterium]
MVWNVSYWANVLKRIAYLLAIIICIFLSFKLAIFYMPFLIAFIISLLMEPAIKLIMKKLNLTRRLSSIIIFIITFGIIIGGLVWGIATLVSESTNLLQGLNNYFEKAYIQIQQFSNNFQKVKISDELLSIFQESSGDLLNKISTWVTNFLNKTLNIITSVPTIGIYLAITILSLYFICTDKIYILDTIEHHMPKVWMKKIGNHLREISATLGGYLKAELILVFVSFIISLVGLYILMFTGFNIKYPLLIALGIAFVDALPILGSGTVMVPWAVVASLDGDIHLGIAIVVIWIIMCIVRQVLEPKVVSNKIGIHPIVTLIGMYTGFKLIGVLGMFAGPIALIVLKNVFSSLLEQGVFKTIFDKR